MKTQNNVALNWYRSLPIHTKINIPEVFYLACGMDWVTAGLMFTMRERIEMLYVKLQMIDIL